MRRENYIGCPTPKWLTNKEKKLSCELTEFIEAKEEGRLHYRNKCEFTIGYSHKSNDEIVVGFNLGNYRKGFMFVESPDESPLVSKEALWLADEFSKFLNKKQS